MTSSSYLTTAARSAPEPALPPDRQSPSAWDIPDLCRLSLAQASAMLDTGETTAVALTEACLQAVTQAQPETNAFIRLDAEQALATAHQMDAQRRAGQVLGPLHGIPLAHKDIFYRPGKVTTAGSWFLRDQVATQQATVLADLDAAGAIDLGTLNLAEFCVGPTGQNTHTGHCRNPWDIDRITGGSSSGSGAAVAARMAFGSIGSDTGGSIRIPAGICGATGLKPSYGRISLHGAVQRCWSLDVFGPIARSAEDVGLLFAAIDRFDPLDPYSRSLHDTEMPLARDWRPTIAVPYDVLDSQPEALACIHREALLNLKAAGARLLPVEPPDVDRLYAATNVINSVEGTWLHRNRLCTAPERFNGSTRSRISRGYTFSALDYLDAVRGRAAERARFTAAYLSQADAVYLPLLEMDVPTLEAVSFDDESGADSVVPRITRWTRFVSYLGVPALALPVGLSNSGIPVAAQLIGRYFEDYTLIEIGQRYQDITDWHLGEPPYVRT